MIWDTEGKYLELKKEVKGRIVDKKKNSLLDEHKEQMPVSSTIPGPAHKQHT